MTGYSINLTGSRNRRRVQEPNAVPRHCPLRANGAGNASEHLAEGCMHQSMTNSQGFERAAARSQRTDLILGPIYLYWLVAFYVIMTEIVNPVHKQFVIAF